MSGPRVSTNPAKLRPWSNIDRPSGASKLGVSGNIAELQLAAVMGNRATRRMAKRRLKKARV